MHPVLFQIGPITIYSYGVMIAIAAVVCALLLSRDAKAQNIPAETIYDLMFWVVAWGILGARIFYVILMWDFFSQNLLEIIMIQHGGLAWQGSFIGGTLAGIWFVRMKKLSLRMVMDLVAPYIALGQAIGRLGCFFNGCCYGKPVAWGVIFPAFTHPVHPTQLYETIGLFLIFLILKFSQNKQRRSGMLFVFYLWLAAIERFVVEFFRADHDYLWLNLSLAQYISLGIFVAGLILFNKFKTNES
jgi:phosphatidylglycerol---prolipoprotein diacylglyceryl transferase